MMKRMIFSFVLLGVMGIHSVMAKDYELQSHFDPSAVQWSKSSGNAAVAGIGIYRTADGLMKSCAGQMILYYPYNDYVLEQLQAKIRGVTHFKNLDSQVTAYRFSVPCDQEGDFHIAHLPAGKWIFVMNIPVIKEKHGFSSYEEASDLSNVAGEGNGILYRIVTIKDNKITTVSLVQGDENMH